MNMKKTQACNARPKLLSALLAVLLALPGCTVQAEGDGVGVAYSNTWSYEGMTVLEDPELFMPLNDTPPDSPDAQETPQSTTTESPTQAPVESPTEEPSNAPPSEPTTAPTDAPTEQPTDTPDTQPTDEPSPDPSTEPSTQPTASPSTEPTTAPTDTPSSSPSPDTTATPEPVQPKYTISISVPTGWRNTSAASARVDILDENGTGWERVRISTGSAGWEDVTDRFSGGSGIDYNVHDNGTMVVRVTDANGEHHEAQAKISCFDRKAPSVSVNVKENPLHVEATDDLSGVAGIQINGLLFTSVQGGKLDVYFDETLRSYEKLSVRAYDYAGNFSEAITLDNPYYGYPAQPTAKPTVKPTVKPTQKPVQRPQATKAPTGNTATAVPTATPYVKPVVTPLPTIIPTAAPTVIPTATPLVIMPTPAPQYIQTGPGEAFTSGGNMQTLDMLYSSHTNKQFITVQSRSGATYYLVIDYDKPIDESSDMYETYFLNLVDDRDILALLSEEDMPTPTPIPTATPKPTQEPTPVPAEGDEPSPNMALVMLLLVAFAGMGVMGYFLLRSQQQAKKKPAYDEFAFDDDEDEIVEDEEDFGEPEDM